MLIKGLEAIAKQGRPITMTEQLRLFPDNTLNLLDTLQDENMADLESAVNPVDEVFASLARFRNSHDFMELMQFITRFPNYSTFNGFCSISRTQRVLRFQRP